MQEGTNNGSGVDTATPKQVYLPAVKLSQVVLGSVNHAFVEVFIELGVHLRYRIQIDQLQMPSNKLR